MKRLWAWIILVVVVTDAWVGLWWWHRWREHRFDQHILAAAQRHQIAPSLIKAVIWRESLFNDRARGRADERGLMQVRMPAANEWADAMRRPGLPPDALFDPRTNITVGSWYLAKLLRRYAATDRPVVFALADYNAGRGNVLRWITGPGQTNSADFLVQMDFPGTRKYIEDVLRRESSYTNLSQ
jgi:soluble lytic murein transglycosylase